MVEPIPHPKRAASLFAAKDIWSGRKVGANFAGMNAAVLLAEPEPSTREFLQRHLADDGFDVLGAHQLSTMVARWPPSASNVRRKRRTRSLTRGDAIRDRSGAGGIPCKGSPFWGGNPYSGMALEGASTPSIWSVGKDMQVREAQRGSGGTPRQ
jgi:hypothetical protein